MISPVSPLGTQLRRYLGIPRLLNLCHSFRDGFRNPYQRFGQIAVDVEESLVFRQMTLSVRLVEYSPLHRIEVKGVLEALKYDVSYFDRYPA